ncbi:MAG: hypothetical protein M3071_09520 [Actinomycetota bacterium]|nr:hypothetical protein [Actinomycetota bacterium]
MSPRSADSHQILLDAIKTQLTRIDELCEAFDRAEEDGVYRYYHQSFKVYGLQSLIRRAMSLFDEVAPAGTELNSWLQGIAAHATAHRFDLARSNRNWQAETRPILEGFWHCHYFIRMLARYGRELDAAPNVLPYGWAAVLYLYDLR